MLRDRLRKLMADWGSRKAAPLLYEDKNERRRQNEWRDDTMK